MADVCCNVLHYRGMLVVLVYYVRPFSVSSFLFPINGCYQLNLQYTRPFTADKNQPIVCCVCVLLFWPNSYIHNGMVVSIFFSVSQAITTAAVRFGCVDDFSLFVHFIRIKTFCENTKANRNMVAGAAFVFIIVIKVVCVFVATAFFSCRCSSICCCCCG